MCLAKAYELPKTDKAILEDIARMSLENGRIELETLLGEKMVVDGRLKEIDFMGSRITIEPC